MRVRNPGNAARAVIAFSAIACCTVLHADTVEPAIAAYSAVPSSGNPRVLDNEASGLPPVAPFSLQAGESTEIDVSSLPSADLPDGLYAAKIESAGQPLAAAALLTLEPNAVIFSDGYDSGDNSPGSSTLQS